MSGVVPVLLYHSVSDQPTGQFGPYTVSRSQLASHLDQVTDLGFQTLTVGQLVAHRAAGLPLPPRTAVITFDDGFADFDNAWAELTQRGLAATLRHRRHHRWAQCVAGPVGGCRPGHAGPLSAARLRRRRV